VVAAAAASAAGKSFGGASHRTGSDDD
jgi:hypothetical protein